MSPMSAEDKARFLAQEKAFFAAMEAARPTPKPKRAARPRQSSAVYFVIVEGIDVPSYFAFRARGVAEKFAAKVVREARADDDYDTMASVVELTLRTGRQLPDW